MRFYLYLILFILGINAGLGAEKKTPAVSHEKTALKIDSASVVDVGHFDQSSLNTYRKNPEFQYKETTTDISWWTHFWRWFWHRLDSLFKSKPGKRLPAFWDIFWRAIKVSLLALGVAALIFFIFKAQGINLLGIFRKKATGAAIPYSEFFEDINVINFDQEIENAVAKANYRFAVRLLYLKCLKHLSNAELIDWQIDKTNNAYISELKNKQQQDAFRMLTLQFEYVWYGEFLIDQKAFKTIDSSFRDFNRQVI